MRRLWCFQAAFVKVLWRIRGERLGTVSSSVRLRSVELYGTQVIPHVRELLAAVT